MQITNLKPGVLTLTQTIFWIHFSKPFVVISPIGPLLLPEFPFQLNKETSLGTQLCDCQLLTLLTNINVHIDIINLQRL